MNITQKKIKEVINKTINEATPGDVGIASAKVDALAANVDRLIDKIQRMAKKDRALSKMANQMEKHFDEAFGLAEDILDELDQQS